MRYFVDDAPVTIDAALYLTELAETVDGPPSLVSPVRLNRRDDVRVKRLVVEVGKGDEVVFTYGRYSVVPPELVRWVPVQPDFMPGTHFELIVGFIRDVVGLVDVEPVTSRSPYLAWL